MTPTLTFTCSICSEPSQMICIYCTKDACGNHLCERCRRCSDCCECELHLDESPEYEHAAPRFEMEPVLMDEVAAEEEILAEPLPDGLEAEAVPPAEPEELSVVAPDLSKLFAPESAADQPAPPVFPTSHAAPREPETETEPGSGQ